MISHTARSLRIFQFAVAFLKANLDEHSEHMGMEPPPTDEELAELYQQLEQAIAQQEKMNSLDLRDVGLGHFVADGKVCYIKEPKAGLGMTSDEYAELRERATSCSYSDGPGGVLVSLSDTSFEEDTDVVDLKLKIICGRVKQHGFEEVWFA